MKIFEYGGSWFNADEIQSVEAIFDDGVPFAALRLKGHLRDSKFKAQSSHHAVDMAREIALRWQACFKDAPPVPLDSPRPQAY